MIRIALLLLSSLLLLHSPLPGQEPTGPSGFGPALVSTTGSADTLVEPDEVVFSLSVESDGKDLADAKSQNAKRVDEALAFLEGAGVEERYIQTRYLNVSVRKANRDVPDPRYVATQSISVRLTDIASYQEVSQGLLDLGVTALNGPNFGYSKADEIRSELRAAAVLDARERASSLAEALGQSIGVAYRIDDSEQGSNSPLYARMASFESAGGVEGPGLAPGELELTATVTAAFYLRP